MRTPTPGATPAEEPLRRWVLEPVVAAAAVVGSVATVRPPDGVPAVVVWGAVVVCSLQAVGRVLPERWWPAGASYVLALVAAVPAGLLVGAASTSLAPLFAFFLSGWAGGRLPRERAAVVAVVVTLTSAVGLALSSAAGVEGWPAYLGLLTGLPVLLGMTRRERVEALAAARRAAREAQRAAEAEARERTLAERGRLARELHDVLAHSLAGVALQLEMVDALLDHGDDEAARRALVGARDLVRTGSREARDAVAALGDEPSPEPLAPALRAAATTFGAELVLEREPALELLPPATAHVVKRVVQESLTNAARHAPGATTSVRVEVGDEDVDVVVANGPGGPSVGGGNGTGLAGMRRRVEACGGSVSAGPHADGWTVRARMPR